MSSCGETRVYCHRRGRAGGACSCAPGQFPSTVFGRGRSTVRTVGAQAYRSHPIARCLRLITITLAKQQLQQLQYLLQASIVRTAAAAARIIWITKRCRPAHPYLPLQVRIRAQVRERRLLLPQDVPALGVCALHRTGDHGGHVPAQERFPPGMQRHVPHGSHLRLQGEPAALARIEGGKKAGPGCCGQLATCTTGPVNKAGNALLHSSQQCSTELLALTPIFNQYVYFHTALQSIP